MTGSHYGPFPSGAGASLGIDEYADYLGPMLQGDGVNTTTYGDATLQVYADNSGLQVRVRPGSAMIRGGMYALDDPATLTIQPNSSTSQRIDRVVLTHNRTSNLIIPTVIVGTPGAGAPALNQTVGGVWQFPLAQVTVAPNAGGIAPGDVADDRQYLPLKVGVCNTVNTTPPVDGSKGRVFYDRNPAVMGLIVTTGSRWVPLTGSADSGWQNLQGIAEGYGSCVVQYRTIGKIVFVRFTGVVHTDSTAVAAIPQSVAPSINVIVPAEVDGGVGGYYLRIPWSGDASVTPVALIHQSGASPNGHTFNAHATYVLY